MKAAIYARVSTSDQTSVNQVLALTKWATARGYTIAKTYQESESAWTNGHQHELARLLDDLESGKRKFDACLVWSLDRITREGIGSLLTLYNRFNQYGCRLISMQESFTEVPNQFTPIFLAMIGFFAQWESNHRSDRTLAGLARARLEAPGGILKKRGKDKKKRRRTGYLLRYAKKKKPNRQNVALINTANKVMTTDDKEMSSPKKPDHNNVMITQGEDRGKNDNITLAHKVDNISLDKQPITRPSVEQRGQVRKSESRYHHVTLINNLVDNVNEVGK
jgi:DNA invertase Pin-like site-specific DNA recombinase